MKVVKKDFQEVRPKRADKSSRRPQPARAESSVVVSPVIARPVSARGVRLQKFLADCGVCARRKAEKLIEQGRVMVNDQVVNQLGTCIDPQTDRVRVNRKLVRPASKGVILLHKPRGVVSTLADPEGRRCIAEYLGKPQRGYFPAGRLDWDSSGLVVLTNDGELAEHLLHPKFAMSRTYQVRVKGRVSERVCGLLCEGVRLSDGKAKFSDLKLISEDEKSAWLEVSICEGRNRIVRRMFDEVGHPVIKLKRISHGPFRLGTLPAGRMRPLTEKEYLLARSKVFGSQRARKQ